MPEGGDQDNQERTEEPTDQRRKQFRDDGQVPVSRDLISTVGMMVTVPIIAIGGGAAATAVAQSFKAPFAMMVEPTAAVESVLTWAPDLLNHALIAMAPAFIVMWLASLLVGIVQTKGNLTFKVLQPKFEKLNPLQGLKKLASPDSLQELLKSILKLVAIGIACYIVFRTDAFRVMALDRADLHSGMRTLGNAIVRLCAAATVALMATAALDYGIQVYRINKKMRMTRDELKRDLKDQEGDPHLRSRRKRIAHQLSANRMIGNVADADVVINNPTHIAVALKYIHGETDVPIVMAMGADQIALRIRAEARRHSIPQLENRTLARTLYQLCEVGQPIPDETFGPVAEVLSFVHRIRGLRGMESENDRASSA